MKLADLKKYLLNIRSTNWKSTLTITDYSSENEGIIRQETQNDYNSDQMVKWAEQEHFEYEETKAKANILTLSHLALVFFPGYLSLRTVHPTDDSPRTSAGGELMASAAGIASSGFATHESVVRFIKLFSPLGLEEDGLQVYVSYLKKVISVREKVEFEELVERMGDGRGNGNGNGNKVDFVGCLTNLFKDIVLAIEDNDEILRSLCGEDGIVYAICELQDECDSRGSLVLKKYMEYRKLSKLTSKINAYKNDVVNGEDVDGPDPREIELFLEEIHILRFPTIYHT
ncbi:conserved oligomeric Golgi complex subunit 4 [Tanacetum coccineum]|uniref:Conserved oligomeric Golgi complex subunit 4 n=1 Tax=Tanacetum coccineum TaxID=301880 RepID=A0ABQ4Z7X4_9ASTR